MKLIDLLVQELPKRGGWTVGSFATQDGVLSADGCCVSFWDEVPESYGDGEQSFWADSGATRANKGYGVRILGDFEVAEDFLSSVISREQYESALAASKQAEWDGEGLPPIGTKCEFINDGVNYRMNWIGVIILAYGDEKVFMRHAASKNEFAETLAALRFRLARTEAERKREEAIEQMMACSAVLVESTAGLLYDAIAAGKIPGIKLAD